MKYVALEGIFISKTHFKIVQDHNLNEIFNLVSKTRIIKKGEIYIFCKRSFIFFLQ